VLFFAASILRTGGLSTSPGESAPASAPAAVPCRAERYASLYSAVPSGTKAAKQSSPCQDRCLTQTVGDASHHEQH